MIRRSMRSLVDAIRAAFEKFRGFVSDPIGTLERLRIRWRRHRLVMAYAKVGQRRYDLGGLSSVMFAYDRILNEELAVIVENDGDREFVWQWPEGDGQ